MATPQQKKFGAVAKACAVEHGGGAKNKAYTNCIKVGMTSGGGVVSKVTFARRRKRSSSRKLGSLPEVHTAEADKAMDRYDSYVSKFKHSFNSDRDCKDSLKWLLSMAMATSTAVTESSHGAKRGMGPERHATQTHAVDVFKSACVVKTRRK